MPKRDRKCAESLIRPGPSAEVGLAQGRDMMMSETALAEFRSNLRAAGPSEAARAERLLARVSVVPDAPSPRALALKPTKKVGENDIRIFGAGDERGALTLTNDGRFVRGAEAQGGRFRVFVHRPVSLRGK